MSQTKEGKATVRAGNGVFFNPKMKKLRDMSVLLAKAICNKNTRLLDCTAATGIRAIRYAKEAGIDHITALDMNKGAYNCMRRNVLANKAKVKVLHKSIQEFANTVADRFDIVDLDPFGTPSPHVFDILKISDNNAVLMVTATDTAVLCGAHGAACIKTYGSRPMHNELCKESGIRVLLNFISKNAALFNFGIEPLLSVSDMHYLRVFVRLHAGAKEAVASVKENGFATFCGSCRSFACSKGMAPIMPSKCAHCSKTTEAYGPIWLGSLQSKETIAKMLKLANGKYEGGKELEAIGNELDIPFFYSIPKITKSLGATSVSPEKVRLWLSGRGIKATRTQFDKDAIKTNGSIDDVLKGVRSSRV